MKSTSARAAEVPSPVTQNFDMYDEFLKQPVSPARHGATRAQTARDSSNRPFQGRTTALRQPETSALRRPLPDSPSRPARCGAVLRDVTGTSFSAASPRSTVSLPQGEAHVPTCGAAQPSRRPVGTTSDGMVTQMMVCSSHQSGTRAHPSVTAARGPGPKRGDPNLSYTFGSVARNHSNVARPYSTATCLRVVAYAAHTCDNQSVPVPPSARSAT